MAFFFSLISMGKYTCSAWAPRTQSPRQGLSGSVFRSTGEAGSHGSRSEEGAVPQGRMGGHEEAHAHTGHSLMARPWSASRRLSGHVSLTTLGISGQPVRRHSAHSHPSKGGWAGTRLPGRPWSPVFPFTSALVGVRTPTSLLIPPSPPAATQKARLHLCSWAAL